MTLTIKKILSSLSFLLLVTFASGQVSARLPARLAQ
jgi:hypothetical protein